MRIYNMFFCEKTRKLLKAPYSSKIDIFLSKKGFNKLIYSINTIINVAFKFQLVSPF